MPAATGGSAKLRPTPARSALNTCFRVPDPTNSFLSQMIEERHSIGPARVTGISPCSHCFPLELQP